MHKEHDIRQNTHPLPLSRSRKIYRRKNIILVSLEYGTRTEAHVDVPESGRAYN